MCQFAIIVLIRCPEFSGLKQQPFLFIMSLGVDWTVLVLLDSLMHLW